MGAQSAKLAVATNRYAPRSLHEPHIRCRVNGTWEVYTTWKLKYYQGGKGQIFISAPMLPNYQRLKQAAKRLLGWGYKTTFDIHYEFPSGELFIIKSVWSRKK